jgi:hypothetical protein
MASQKHSSERLLERLQFSLPIRRTDVTRREFIMLVGGAAIGGPRATQAQRRHPRPLVGWLGGAARRMVAPNLDGFLQGLRDHGHEDGKTVDVVYRWAEGDLSRLSALAKELIALEPDVILSASTAGNVVLMRSTATIPIVGALIIDPIALGLAVSHNRPGRNLTGVLQTSRPRCAARRSRSRRHQPVRRPTCPPPSRRSSESLPTG